MKHLITLFAAALLAIPATAQLTCSSTSCGTSCGPTLTLSYTPLGGAGNYKFQMDAAGLHPNAFTVLQWGDGPQNIQLPGGCLYLINPIWGTFHTSSAAGTFSWSRSWPHWATASFHMQMGSLHVDGAGNLDIRTTECRIGACF